MAEIKKQMITCPKCGGQIEIGVWDCIELPKDQEQKDRIINNRFFNVECYVCKTFLPIGYKCIYNDMERKYFLWFLPRLAEEEQQEVDAYNERLKTDDRLRLAQGGYRYRIVRSVSELREKILIFDEGLDDRYIETMKTVYVPVIKKKIAEDCKVTGMYLNKVQGDKGYVFLVVFDNRPPMNVSVNMDIYKDMQDKLHTLVEQRSLDGLISINANWAMEIMTTRVESIA